jgi:hypothetical protein
VRVPASAGGDSAAALVSALGARGARIDFLSRDGGDIVATTGVARRAELAAALVELGPAAAQIVRIERGLG